MATPPPQPPLDELCKLLLTGDHADIVTRHSKPLTDALALVQLFDLLEENWDVVLLGILQYVANNGKCPDAKSVYQFMTMSRDVRFEKAHHLIIDMEKELADIEADVDDPAVLIERVIDDINQLALKKLLQNALDIGRGRTKPAQCLAMKDPKGIKDAQSCNITIQHTDGTTTVDLFVYTLLTGEAIYWTEGQGFYAVDANGNIKTVIPNVATIIGADGKYRCDWLQWLYRTNRCDWHERCNLGIRAHRCGDGWEF